MTSSLVGDGGIGLNCAARCLTTARYWRRWSVCVGLTLPIPMPSATTSGCNMSKRTAPLPESEWELVLSSAAHLQRIVPDAVLVGGTASAVHAKHRFSRDADHVLTDLRSRFDLIRMRSSRLTSSTRKITASLLCNNCKCNSPMRCRTIWKTRICPSIRTSCRSGTTGMS